MPKAKQDNRTLDLTKNPTEPPVNTPKMPINLMDSYDNIDDDEMLLINKKTKLKITILNELCINDLDSVVLQTILHIIERAKIGRTKYKTDLDRTDKDILSWVQDAVEESLDKSLYLHKVQEELQKLIDKNILILS